MNEIERLLERSLTAVGRDFRPSDVYAAQQEFLVRRRRRRSLRLAVAMAGAAAVAVGAVALVQSNPFRDDVSERSRPAARLALAATIPAGQQPTGIYADDHHVWIANEAGRSVSVVGTADDLPDAPIEVGVNADDVVIFADRVWASSPEDGVIAFADADDTGGDPSDVATIHQTITVSDRGRHIDLAAGLDAVWAVARGDALYRVDPVRDEATRLGRVAAQPTDVAVGQEGVWVLDGDGMLVEVDPGDGSFTRRVTLEIGEHSDLVVDDRFVWIASGDRGSVVRYDPARSTLSDEVLVGGNYIGLAVGEGYVWALAFDAGDVGTLYRIDPTTAQTVGTPLQIEGHPVDVAVGGGSVWVTNNDADTVTRIEIVEP